MSVEAALTQQKPIVVSYRHSCRTCGRAFQRATGLERHRRSAHSKEKPFGCEYCSQTFSRTDLLQRHVSLYHKTIREREEEFQMQSTESNEITRRGKEVTEWNQSYTPQYLSSVEPFDLSTMVNETPLSTAPMPSQTATEAPVLDSEILSWFYSNMHAPSLEETSTLTAASSSHFQAAALTDELRNSFPSSTSTSSSSGATSSLFPLSTAYTTPPFSSAFSSSSSALTLDNIWPTPSLRHLDLYRVNFANHLPFIHLASLLQKSEEASLDEDLIRAVATLGANYDDEGPMSSAADGVTGITEGKSRGKWCDYYCCGALKAKVVASVEDLQCQQEQPSRRVLLRRTQTFVLLQILAMFSESAKHLVAAKLSHGALIAIARELLKEYVDSMSDTAPSSSSSFSSWSDWIAREEVIRTLWAVYIVDSLQSFCFHRAPWFGLAELSEIPSMSSDALWNAPDEATFHRLLAQFGSSHNSNGNLNIFEIVGTLHDDGDDNIAISSPQPWPSNGSLSSLLLALISIATEISSLAHSDSAARKQLAARHRRNESQSPETLSHSLYSLNTQLKKHIEEGNRTLGRWLSLLQSSAASMESHSLRKTSSGKPHFMEDMMPWYWMCTHLLSTLEQRQSTVVEERHKAGSPNSNSTVEQNIMSWMASRGKQLQRSPSSTKSAEIHDKDASPLEVMQLLVRVRLALHGLDGGASMQSFIGTSRFGDSLPIVKSPPGMCAVVDLFPRLTLI